MSRRLTQPLTALQAGARAISNNDLSHRVDIMGTDEMGEVAHAFNQMAAQLEQAEALRRNLLADVAHELRHTGENGRITLSIEQKDEALQVRVHDTGEGIAPENLPYVFDRFYRTDSARNRNDRGTGLGLAIVRALVEAHGGEVTAVSPGLGEESTFTFSLPLS
jgi:signal transduction histidine kinase